MKQRAPFTLLAAACLAALAGCSQTTAPYDRARLVLEQSRAQLIDGDVALAGAGYDRAAKCYDKAAKDLAATARDLEAAEKDVQAKLGPGGTAEPTAAAGDGDGVSRFYTETLRGYRESLALAVVMRSVALGRAAEARYRSAAQGVVDGDRFYQARQFAAAHSAYADAGDGFSAAMKDFSDTAVYVGRQVVAGRRLAEVAPQGTWTLLEPLRRLATHRGTQADAYKAVAASRAAQADEIVQAYRRRKPGNLPEIDVRPLAPLPELVRRGVTHPAIPPVALARRPAP